MESDAMSSEVPRILLTRDARRAVAVVTVSAELF
jgi:hypothetical protein